MQKFGLILLYLQGSDPANDPANPKYVRLDDQAGIPGECYTL